MARSFEACGKTAERYRSHYKSLPIFLTISGFWQCEELLSSSMQFWICFHSFILVQINTLSIMQKFKFCSFKTIPNRLRYFQGPMDWNNKENALVGKKYIA